MPFHGILPERRQLFHPTPISDIGVNDQHAWRLNPAHRHVYNKLALANWQGLTAHTCQIKPCDRGIPPDQLVFVKPITNLAGMSLGARALPASEVPDEQGSFWCERLPGRQTSSDCLVKNGQALWFAHTRAASEKNRQRPIYWEIGVQLEANETVIAKLLRDQLSDYTGLLNVEIIDGYIIEAHLRGSNAFFDFYGEHFVPAWVKLMDTGRCEVPPPIPGGVVYSVFSEHPLTLTQEQDWPFADVSMQVDHHTPDRLCILRSKHLDRAHRAATWLLTQR